jgi:hypothetical protein
MKVVAFFAVRSCSVVCLFMADFVSTESRVYYSQIVVCVGIIVYDLFLSGTDFTDS